MLLTSWTAVLKNKMYPRGDSQWQMLKYKLHSDINRFLSAHAQTVLHTVQYLPVPLTSPTAGERALSQCHCLSKFPWECLFILNIITCWEFGSPIPAAMKDTNKCFFSKLTLNLQIFEAGRLIPTARWGWYRKYCWLGSTGNGIKWDIAKMRGEKKRRSKGNSWINFIIWFKIREDGSHTWGIFFKLS